MDLPISVRSALLLVLSRHDSSGTDAIKEIDHLTGEEAHLSYGSVYPALHAMREEGLLTAYAGAPAKRGGRRHQRYRLTTAGEREAGRIREILEAILRGRKLSRLP